jgi:hypothetical protein
MRFLEGGLQKNSIYKRINHAVSGMSKADETARNRGCPN